MIEWQEVQMRMFREQMQAQPLMFSAMVATLQQQQPQPSPVAVESVEAAAEGANTSVKLIALIAGDSMEGSHGVLEEARALRTTTCNYQVRGR